jgi:hypothetical protein
MKKSIFITVALFAFTSLTNQLFAQDAMSKTSGYDLKKSVKFRITPTDGGCLIAIEHDANSTREAGSGLATGRRQYKPLLVKQFFEVSSSDNAVMEIKSPRDAASGLPTGKRMHKPFTITKELDKSSPMSAEPAASSETSVSKESGGGSGKVNVQDFHFIMRCGGKSTQISCEDVECEIPTGDCPDGTCSVIASWSWGATNSSSSSLSKGSSLVNRCSVDFSLEIENGECTAMAINEKGTGGTKGTTK